MYYNSMNYCLRYRSIRVNGVARQANKNILVLAIYTKNIENFTRWLIWTPLGLWGLRKPWGLSQTLGPCSPHPRAWGLWDLEMSWGLRLRALLPSPPCPLGSLGHLKKPGGLRLRGLFGVCYTSCLDHHLCGGKG